MSGVLAPAATRLPPAGFTLLEILVAVAILGLAYLVVLQNFSLSLRNIERVEQGGLRGFAAELAVERELMAIPGQLQAEPPAGEIYARGRQYQLVQVEGDKSPGRTVLLLERWP